MKSFLFGHRCYEDKFSLEEKKENRYLNECFALTGISYYYIMSL